MAFLRKYIKEYWKKFERPNLTANGTMGGDSFAVSASSALSGNEAWKAVDGSSDNGSLWQSVSNASFGEWFTFYNPTAIKLNSLLLEYSQGQGYYYPKEIKIQGSDDNSSWVDLTTFTNSTYSASYNIAVNSSTAYKYHRLLFTNYAGYNSGNMYVLIRNLGINGEIFLQKPSIKAYNIMRRNREYFKYTTWNQPILTSATSYGTITASSDHSTDTSEPWHILSSGSTVGGRFLFTGTSNEWLKWQLPEPIKISSCTVYNSAETSYLNRFPKSITLQVSDDGSVWKTIGSASNYNQPGNKESISFYCNSDKAYSYIRWQFANTFGSSPMAVGVIIINAKKVSNGTSSSYDFYKDSFKTYNIVNQSKEIITQRFDYTGALQTYTVPEGVTSVQVDCVGAKGYTASLAAGLGGRVKANLTVTPGQELKVWVGQAHSQITTPEYNASDIRTSSAGITSEEGLLSRLIVAGGGGDGSQTNWGGGEGGHGGGLIGGSGRGGYGTVATGGTQTAGGSGGTHGAAYGGGSGKGNSGTFGLGGATKAYGAGSGGCGGAGWYGGGGGSMCTVNKIAYVNGVSGAGGSSYTHPDLCSEVTHTQGYQSGNGYVKITYRRRRF